MAFGNVVEAIVDHHKDFEKHTGSVLDGCRVIQPVGSACTLVAQSMEVGRSGGVPGEEVFLLCCGDLYRRWVMLW